MRKVADEFELTLGEDLRKKFEDMQQAEEEWERIKKGPMGTVLTDEEDEGFEVDTTLDDVWPDGSPETGVKD